MKKLLLISIAISSFAFTAASAQTTVKDNIAPKVDEQKAKIDNTRSELADLGYSIDMMNDLFGDEDFYFPINSEVLETSIYITDLLITNGQYTEEDKEMLVKLTNDAYALYTGVQATSASTANLK